MRLKLRWLLLRSLLSRKDKELEPVARESREKGREIAIQVINRQRQFLLAKCIYDMDLAEYVADLGSDYQISYELQFLWGLFCEHVKHYALPTDEYSRTKIHLIDWLVMVHGFKLDAAVQEVNKIADMYNKCEPLFEIISKNGRRSYMSPNEEFMFTTFNILMDQQKCRPDGNL